MSVPPFPLLAMLRLAARGMRARGWPVPADAAAPRHRTARERAALRADPARLAVYLRATAGDRIPAFAGEGALLPPFFPATWELGLGLEMLSTLERPLPLGAVVHAGSEVTWARPIRAGDAVRCRVELDRVEQTRRGLKLTVRARNWTGAGQLCTESTSTLLIRTGASGENGKREPRIAPAPSAGEWRELERWHLSAAAGRRYARASGDYNPIHLWPLTARAFGFRAPILHGYAIAARAAHGLIAHCLGGDPTALRRMGIGFRAPLLLLATAVLLVSEAGGERRFRVAAGDGAAVCAEGVWGGAGAG